MIEKLCYPLYLSTPFLKHGFQITLYIRICIILYEFILCHTILLLFVTNEWE